MEIGKKIKQRRMELGITQEALAERINVARSTVSNWEIGRNYPDIQTIVLLSDELDLSLDELLKGDELVVKKIARDTKVRKKNKTVIAVLSGLVLILGLLFIWMAGGQPGRVQLVSRLDEIEIVSLEKEAEDYTLTVRATDLPAYRSLTQYSLSENEQPERAISLMLGTDLDLPFREEKPLEIRWDNALFGEAEILNITDGQGEVLKTIDLTK